MKKLAIFILAISCTLANAQSMRFATYNMRYDNVQDTANAWSRRLPIIAQIIRFHDFDLFGAQELLSHQVDGVKSSLPGYDVIGVGRDDGLTKGEYSPIFFKTERYKLLQKGTFWLSETPDKPSKGWDAALPRICSWGKFEDKKTNKKFFVFNTHFDHKGEVARLNSAKLILQQIAKISDGTPIVLMGDFNFDQHHAGYMALQTGELKDSFGLSPLTLANTSTFNNFDITTKGDKRIDHIFVEPGTTIIRYGILTDSYQGKLPSDHYPVMVELKME
jgi:endonuclease/exonuclease/phosphatase family metal-dependent hydrolase